jgi:hypothetical protein
VEDREQAGAIPGADMRLLLPWRQPQNIRLLSPRLKLPTLTTSPESEITSTEISQAKRYSQKICWDDGGGGDLDL